MGKSAFRVAALVLSLAVFGLLLWNASKRSDPPVIPIPPVAPSPTPTPTPAARSLIREFEEQQRNAVKSNNSFHLGATKSDPHMAQMLAEEMKRAAKTDGGTK
jgi:hypothetical protein